MVPSAPDRERVISGRIRTLDRVPRTLDDSYPVNGIAVSQEYPLVVDPHLQRAQIGGAEEVYAGLHSGIARERPTASPAAGRGRPGEGCSIIGEHLPGSRGRGRQ